MKKKSKYNVALVGATGAVGQEMLNILEERKFPIDRIRFIASEKSAGKAIAFKNQSYTLEALRPGIFKDVDIVLSSAGGSISKAFAPDAVASGAVIVDNTSAFRMDPQVPLIVPEINAKDIKKHKGIIANPNCSTIIMLVPLFPLYRKNRIKTITCATYQAVSGAGAKAMEELHVQAGEVLAGKKPTINVLPHQTAFNVFSHNSAVGDDGYNEEEMKMVKETWKILNDKNVKLSVTCVRVPVFRAHSEAIFVEFEKEMTPKEASA